MRVETPVWPKPILEFKDMNVVDPCDSVPL